MKLIHILYYAYKSQLPTCMLEQIPKTYKSYHIGIYQEKEGYLMGYPLDPNLEKIENSEGFPIIFRKKPKVIVYSSEKYPDTFFIPTLHYTKQKVKNITYGLLETTSSFNIYNGPCITFKEEQKDLINCMFDVIYKEPMVYTEAEITFVARIKTDAWNEHKVIYIAITQGEYGKYACYYCEGCKMHIIKQAYMGEWINATINWKNTIQKGSWAVKVPQGITAEFINHELIEK